MEPSASLMSFVFSAFIVVIIPLTGIFTALLPYLMPKRECFAVTVPDFAQTDPQLRTFKRRYATIISALTAAITIACIIALVRDAIALATGIMGVGVVLICFGSYALMLFFRAKVHALKKKRGWQAQAEKTVAYVGDEPMPHALSLKWDLLFLPLILISLGICILGYEAIPKQIPTQIGLDGNITTYVQKSPAMACFPALTIAFIDAILAFGHWQILRSKKFTDPNLPAASAWAYGMFARAQSMLLVASGVLLGFVGLAMSLSFVGIINIGQAAVWCLACVMIVVIGSMALSFIYGQNGSRLIARVVSDKGLQRDNDRFWKLGIFYMNRDDPSLFLPERFGIGWTMNWGRIAAWAITVGFIVVVVIFIIAAFAITG